MNTYLLDKPVLCVIDTRSVQKFMFHTNSTEQNVGAGLILDVLPVDSVRHAVANLSPRLAPDEFVIFNPEGPADFPSCDDSKVKVMLVDCSASNLTLFFRTGKLCRDVVRKMARYYLDNGYSLQFTPACTEWTGNARADIAAAFRRLGKNKGLFPGAHPLEPLSIVRMERHSGEPVAYIDRATGEEYSRVSMLRRKGFAELCGKSVEMPVRRFRRSDGRGFYGVAHIDGNGLGALIRELINGPSAGSNPFYIRRAITRNISRVTDCSFKAAIADVQKAFGLSDAQMEQEVKVLHNGGDDLNIAAGPEIVFPLVERYLAHLSDFPMWEDAQRKIFISACAGIALVGEEVDYFRAFDYAEACCGRAKDAAKAECNLVNGLSKSWLDFCLVHPDMANDSEADRDVTYAAMDGTGLMLRPYSVDPVFRDTPRSYEKFKQRVDALGKMGVSHETVARLMHVFGMNVSETRLYCNGLKVNGRSVVDQLGQPIVRDYGRNRVAWYDALELYDFMHQMDWRNVK